MDPLLEHDLHLATELTLPPQQGSGPRMGCHSNPVRAWALPASTGDWRLVEWATSCECCDGGNVPNHFTLSHDEGRWRLSGRVVAAPDQLSVRGGAAIRGVRSDDELVVDLRTGRVSGTRVLTRLAEDGTPGAQRTSHRQWTLDEGGLDWPVDVPKAWR